MKQFFVSSKCVISFVVIFFILFTQSLTLITSGPRALVTVLPFPLGASIDVYTQRDGKGLNESSDAFAPQELVTITAYLTYDGIPVAGKVVNFRLYLPNGTLVWCRFSETDDNGLAFTAYSIPSKPVFGLYSADASVSVEGETVSDTLWFRVGWLVEILEVLPCDRNSVPKSQFEKGEPFYLTVKLQNIRFHPTNTTLTVTVLDELLDPVVFEAYEYVIPPNQTTVLLNLGAIPEWAHVGNATAYVCALEWLGGPVYCPEVAAWFIITQPIPDVAIVGVTTSSFEIYVGQSVNITVSVLNEYYRPQSFNVTVYANTTVIQTLTITNLTPYIQTNFTFIWDSYGVSPGNYTISAYAHPVPGETDTTDNTYIDNTVTILNSPPTIDSFTPTNTTPEVSEGNSLEFIHTSSDPDGDPLTYSWLLDSVEQSTTQNWTYSPDYDDAGTHNVTLVVSDGELTDSQQWIVTVIDVNRPPTIDSHYPSTNPTIKEGESQDFNITKFDLDGDPLTVTWWLNQSDTGETSDSYTYTANYESAGTYNVTVVVSDGLSQTSHQWMLTVINVERDIAIVNVIPSKDIVGEGYSVSINVTITNQGELTETFNVTVYANTTIIKTLTNITLASGNSTNFTFTWNTTGVPYGNYSISAKVTSVPGETDTGDNNKTDGWVVVTIPGDVNGDRSVNIKDVVTVALAFGSKPGDSNWNPIADVWQDGVIDIKDIVTVTIHFGETYP